MPRFEGVHQPFKPKNPYWNKPAKTELQKKYFKKMKKAVNAQKKERGSTSQTHNNPYREGGDHDYEDIGLLHDMNNEERCPNAFPDFINDIHEALLEVERQERQRQLEKALHDMFGAYLECGMKTSEWGNPATWDFDHKAQCRCPPSQWRERNVDLVDLLTRRKAQIRFCPCYQSDQTRLILMGYIGGSPKYPQTAFSIRLLRFFHTLWKFCTVRIDPFVRALDGFLNGFNPFILTKNDQPWRWHTPFTWAVDAYRLLLAMTESAIDEQLRLTALDKVAENCPRCFGPPIPLESPASEPDIVVCMDGNFQHRRHIAAGTKAGKVATKMPPLMSL
ncbi:uncharacterized protein MELLADRAFT_92438 [Melampsora larici-populina 98AG31]|uniref:CxC1-like cysteine cluster associated with KDZ transposases domain-containing protein n=1 Tax=Melampsora larici-populina (strain 98AG31 / pathotype 3-4-7) TaxID=747676 RepID=F4R9N7_MELLP|nr:uncharacterized protein MELLADRAFT_92438 [Melampsora larici-populina 98AG31]EGG11011.1 hypothetical protein MELLADRAFT_92438 [Melampsora larici-populina 98AG31]